jgi:hypothetical protein
LRAQGKRSGKKAKRSGKKAKRSGKKAKRSGKKAKRSGKKGKISTKSVARRDHGRGGFAHAIALRPHRIKTQNHKRGRQAHRNKAQHDAEIAPAPLSRATARQPALGGAPVLRWQSKGMWGRDQSQDTGATEGFEHRFQRLAVGVTAAPPGPGP